MKHFTRVFRIWLCGLVMFLAMHWIDEGVGWANKFYVNQYALIAVGTVTLGLIPYVIGTIVRDYGKYLSEKEN